MSDNSSEMQNNNMDSNPLSSIAQTPNMRSGLLKIADVIHRTLHKPKELARVFPRAFIIGHSTITHLYDLVEQRLANEGDHLAYKTFSMHISFDNQTSYKFNSFEEYSEYNETRDVVPVSLTLNWITMINFPDTQDDDSPQKQEITITFTMPSRNDAPAEIPRILLHRGRGILSNSAIIVDIEHTNRIWALDILRHIEDFIGVNVEKPQMHSLRSFIFMNINFWSRLAKIIVSAIPFIILLALGIREYSLIQNLDSVTNTLLLSKISIFFIWIGIVGIIYYLVTIVANFFEKSLKRSISKLRPKSYILIGAKVKGDYSDDQKQASFSIFVGALKLVGTIFVDFIGTYLSVFLMGKI